MTFQTTLLASDAYRALRDNTPGWKANAQNSLLTVQTTSINSDFVFRLLDQLKGVIAAVAQWTAVSGLGAYATAQGYSGDIVADANTISTAATNCGLWIINNFPKDAQGFAQAVTINGDGSRTLATFAPSSTGGLQTTLTALIATIQ